MSNSKPVPQETEQEYYEFRTYQVFDFEKQEQVQEYLQTALIPALNRIGIDRVGAFSRIDDENDHSVYMLIPFAQFEQFSSLNERLAADQVYMAAAAAHFARELKDPAFARIESRFMKAFSGMPVIELPAGTAEKQPRIFELRLYESHTEHHAALKVDMFNSGEIQLMKDVQMAPVFYGETLVGPRVPNLIYMLSASDEAAHKEHWKSFLAHPEWDRMKKLEKYKDTVSKIDKWFLRPLPSSQI